MEKEVAEAKAEARVRERAAMEEITRQVEADSAEALQEAPRGHP